MKAAPLPSNEKRRLQVLQSYEILDSLPELAFDRIAELASTVCKTPISLVSLIDQDRQWFKSRVGLAAQETPRDLAFCAHAILVPDEILIVEDTTKDARFWDNPLVIGDPKIRFYAGCPLKAQTGEPLGTLCVIDQKPNSLSPEQAELLRILAGLVCAELEARHTTQKLFQQEARHQQLIDGVADHAIYWLDINGNVSSWNSGAENIKFYKENEIIGHHFSRFFTDDDKNNGVPQKMLDVAVATGKFSAEGWRVRKDGSRFWASVTLASVFDHNGTLSGFAKVTRDISERRQFEKALLESDERYDLVERGMNVGAWDWKIAEQEMYWSDKLNSIFGITDRNFKPSLDYFSDHLHPDDRQATLQMLNDHLAQRGPYNVDYRIQRPDGNYIWVNAAGQAKWDSHGVAVRMAGSVVDISERKKAEQDKEALVDKLLSSNTELERFAYVASHDMQEPLRMIANFGKLIGDEYKEKIDAEGQIYIELVAQAAIRMQAMVKDLLEYARVGSDAKRFIEVNMTQELKHVEENLVTTVSEHAATITCDQLPTVMGNPVQLMRLMQNLISNGLKYQRLGNRPQIQIGVNETETEFCFSIRDNGIGMKAENTKKVFEAFQRLHSWQEYQGSGIGLAICQKIVENHGGRIWVTSEIDKGSTFYFTMPKLQEKVDPVCPSVVPKKEA